MTDVGGDGILPGVADGACRRRELGRRFPLEGARARVGVHRREEMAIAAIGEARQLDVPWRRRRGRLCEQVVLRQRQAAHALE
jgi:hypothetical protein